MNSKKTSWFVIIRLTVVTMILCGLIYPLTMTGLAQVIAPGKANGSLIYSEDKKIVGSSMIGQSFTEKKYFHGRISSIEYNGAGSGSSNLAPSNKELTKRVEQSISDWKRSNSVPESGIPIDLVTNSASGLDPHITPEAAYAQVERIAKETNVSKQKLTNLINENIVGGTIQPQYVNVLELNMALQDMK